jgi:hypothetical protein
MSFATAAKTRLSGQDLEALNRQYDPTGRANSRPMRLREAIQPKLDCFAEMNKWSA